MGKDDSFVLGRKLVPKLLGIIIRLHPLGLGHEYLVSTIVGRSTSRVLVRLEYLKLGCLVIVRDFFLRRRDFPFWMVDLALLLALLLVIGAGSCMQEVLVLKVREGIPTFGSLQVHIVLEVSERVNGMDSVLQKCALGAI